MSVEYNFPVEIEDISHHFIRRTLCRSGNTRLIIYKREGRNWVWENEREITQDANERLNSLGEEGWELFNFEHLGSDEMPIYFVFVLKRPKE